MDSQNSNHASKTENTTILPSSSVSDSPELPIIPYRPGKSDPRALMRQIRTQPHTLRPRDAIELQRLIGNSAFTRLIQEKNTVRTGKSESKKNPTDSLDSKVPPANLNPGEDNQPDSSSNEVQRLLSNSGQLYVPRGWANQTVTFNAEDATIATLLGDKVKKANLIQALKNDNLDPDLYDITVEDKGSNIIEEVKDQLPKHSTENRLARQKVNEAFQNFNKLMKLNGVQVATAAALPENLILNAKDMLPEPDDLDEEMNIAYVCALIAVVKAEGKPAIRSFLTGKITKLPGVTAADQVYYKAMHDYYYNTKGILYDEMSTHPQIFNEWGFSMIFSGKRNWEHLYKNSPQLQTGKKYIFDVEGELDDSTLGHTMYVTLKKDFTGPMEETEGLSDYFECHNDDKNWTERHFNCQVINIYSK